MGMEAEAASEHPTGAVNLSRFRPVSCSLGCTAFDGRWGRSSWEGVGRILGGPCTNVPVPRNHGFSLTKRCLFWVNRCSGRCPCLFDVEFPLSGPRYRILTSELSRISNTLRLRPGLVHNPSARQIPYNISQPSWLITNPDYTPTQYSNGLLERRNRHTANFSQIRPLQ